MLRYKTPASFLRIAQRSGLRPQESAGPTALTLIPSHVTRHATCKFDRTQTVHVLDNVQLHMSSRSGNRRAPVGFVNHREALRYPKLYGRMC